MGMSVIYRHPGIYGFLLNLLERRNERNMLLAGIIGGGSLVDFGCGTGSMSRYVKSFSGFEMNDRFIESARREGLDVKKADITRKIKCVKKYDWALVHDVLHHVGAEGIDGVMGNAVRNAHNVLLCEPHRTSRLAEKIANFFDKDGINEMKTWMPKDELVAFYHSMEDKYPLKIREIRHHGTHIMVAYSPAGD